MKVLVRKMSSLGLLKFRMISGTILMTAAMISIPVLIACMDVTLFLNPYVLGFVITEMLFFGLVVYFFCIRPYFTYRALPEVLVETDGEFLYIHSKKEAKIPISEIEEVVAFAELPYIYQKEFLAEFIIHVFSEEYGTLVLEFSKQGKFKIPFVSQVRDTADTFIGVVNALINRESV